MAMSTHGSRWAPVPLVLVVDDNDDGRELSLVCLHLAGFEVMAAPDGETALRLAAERRPTVILLDLVLPGLDGWTVATRLRADESLCDVPIVAFSASVYPKQRAHALAVGCVGFLEKPANPREIVNIVRRAMDGGAYQGTRSPLASS